MNKINNEAQNDDWKYRSLLNGAFAGHQKDRYGNARKDELIDAVAQGGD